MARGVLARGLLLAVLPALANAEERPVTLAEALALADKANPELQAAVLRIEAQRARTESVERARWPEPDQTSITR